MSMHLTTVRVVLRNEVNEVLICENADDPGHELFTVIDVKDHERVRRFLNVYETCNNPRATQKMQYFSDEGKYRIIYPYVKERPLHRFYRGDVLSIEESEEICKNLIISCMTDDLPWPILYLVLTQQQVHLAADRSVYLSYMIDLSELDETITERECVVACAKILLELLDSKSKQKADSYVLLSKKTQRESYIFFTELYKDIDVAGAQSRKGKFLDAIRFWFKDNKDRLFRILLVIAIIMVLFTLISLITNALFGDIPWLRLFIRSFETIGLESLLQ